MERPRRPWYRRPGRIIPLALSLALLLALVPPLLAAPTPVGLSPAGAAAAQAGGWYPSEIGTLEVELAGGLVRIQAEALSKDDAGGVAAAYSWSSVKLPVTGLVPRHLVEERLRDAVIDNLQREGLRVEPLSERASTFTGNGHNGQLTQYLGSTRGSDVLSFEVDVEIAILTWRCNMLGAYGFAFGVGKIDELATEEDVIDFLHDALQSGGADGGLGDPFGDLGDPLGGLVETPELPDLDDPADVPELGELPGGTAHSPFLVEILRDLMPHTVCAP